MTDLSYYKTLELLNQYLEPVQVHGFRKYHSDFETDENNFKIEPDLSLGSNGVEIITGPLEYFKAKYYLIKILKFIQDYGYTTEKCAIHFNISFLEGCDKDLNNLNILKLILSTDEDEIYRVYPSRKGNIYAKTVKKVIPFKEYDYNSVAVDSIKNTLRLPDDKYYGINFLHINNPRESQRLEYRYIGGTDYQKNTGQILYFLDRFILDVWDSINGVFTNKNVKDLETYLKMNISNFKNFSKDGFKLRTQKTIEALRYINLNKKKDDELDIRIGHDNLDLAVIGVVWNPSLKPLECFKAKDLINVNTLSKKNPNNFSTFMKTLNNLT
jgi:hypothetical protein